MNITRTDSHFLHAILLSLEIYFLVTKAYDLAKKTRIVSEVSLSLSRQYNDFKRYWNREVPYSWMKLPSKRVRKARRVKEKVDEESSK
jgi:hypothetical protein